MAEENTTDGEFEPATLGGGCFWGMEKYFVNEVWFYLIAHKSSEKN